MRKFPTHILLKIISFLDERRDILAFGLTNREFSQRILDYTHISCSLGEISLWYQLQNSPAFCTLVKELCIGDSPGMYPVPQRIPKIEDEVILSMEKHIKGYMLTMADFMGSFEPETSDVEVSSTSRTPEEMVRLAAPAFIRTLPYLNNLTSVKFILNTLAPDMIKKITNALILSKPVLKTFDMNINWKTLATTVPWSNESMEPSSLPPRQILTLNSLSVWRVLDTSYLTKCAIHLVNDGVVVASKTPEVGQTMLELVSCSNWDFVLDLLSNAPELSHLYICVKPVVQIKILGCSWPQLEHITIQDVIINSSISAPDPEELRSFFQRHPNLQTVSLPPTSYPSDTIEHYITEGILPDLRSFGYDDTGRTGLYVFPALCQVLSPSAARNLTHLTVHLVDSARQTLYRDFYGKYRNLESCCLAGTISNRDESEALSKILENFIAHACNICCLQLPKTRSKKKIKHIISLVRLLPKLTHLFGLFTGFDIEKMESLGLLKRLIEIPRLKYINIAEQKVLCLYRNISEKKMDHKVIEATELHTHPSVCNKDWGGFYYGTITG